MKNMQLVEPAENCWFAIYSLEEDDFALIFPAPGQDVEFFEDVVKRLGKSEAHELLVRTTRRYVHKPDIHGIHGTLFCDFEQRKKHFPNKQYADLDVIPRGRQQQPAE